jgi:hypothetical protein
VDAESIRTWLQRGADAKVSRANIPIYYRACAGTLADSALIQVVPELVKTSLDEASVSSEFFTNRTLLSRIAIDGALTVVQIQR